jgi:hypothetical protein
MRESARGVVLVTPRDTILPITNYAAAFVTAIATVNIQAGGTRRDRFFFGMLTNRVILCPRG